MKSRILLLAAVCAIVGLVVTRDRQPTQAQGSCNLWADIRSPFPQGSVVYLDLSALTNSSDPKLRAWAQQTIVAAENWNQALAQTAADVSFNYTDPAPPGARRVTVKPGTTSPGSPAAIPKFGSDGLTSDSNGNLQTATVNIDLNATFPSGNLVVNPLTSVTIGAKVMGHEFGHLWGLGEASPDPASDPLFCGKQSDGATVMNGICGHNDSANNMPSGVTGCDLSKASQIIDASSPQPTPTPTPEGGGCEFGGCEAGCFWSCEYGTCVGSGCDSPVIIDTDGDGIDLTSPVDGVWFDLNTYGPRRYSWTRPDSDDAWLVLDRNHNSKIDNGRELFGNFTEQPTVLGRPKNGFHALAELDNALGNGNGMIDSGDLMFSGLRLWFDANHNGVSEETELVALQDAGIMLIDLQYKQAERRDKFGNKFRYRAKIFDVPGFQVGRWAWDVFPVSE